MFSEFVAIDPLALLLPTSIYLIYQEKINPHQPALTVINEVVKSLTPEQVAYVQARITTLNAYTGAVSEALKGQASAARG